MKRFFFILFALIGLSAYAASPSRLFADVAKMRGVSSVYMGSSLMASYSQDMHLFGLGLYSDAVKNVKMIEVISAEDEADVAAVAATCNKIIDAQNLEVLVESTDGDEVDRILFAPPAEGSTTTESLVIISSSEDEYEVIHICGDIDISKVIGFYARGIRVN